MSALPDEKLAEATGIWKYLLQLLECNAFLGKTRGPGPETLLHALASASVQNLKRTADTRRNASLKSAVINLKWTEWLLLAG